MPFQVKPLPNTGIAKCSRSIGPKEDNNRLHDSHYGFFARFFRSRLRLCFASSFKALTKMRTVLSMSSAAVSPGNVRGRGGFIRSHHTADSRFGER
jgi:hypothetical protein